MGTVRVPVPVDRSGANVSPRPAADPPPGRDGAWLANPMSTLMAIPGLPAGRSRPRRERVAQDEGDVVDVVDSQRAVMDPARIVGRVEHDPVVAVRALAADRRVERGGVDRSV